VKLIITASFAFVLISACKPTDGKPAGAATPPPASSSSGQGIGHLPPSAVVAEWSGQKLTYGELMQKKESTFKKLHDKYLTDLHQAELREVESYVIEDIVTKASKAAGKTEEEFLRGMAGEPVEPTEAEIQAFYEAQVKNTGQPLEAVKDRIKGFLVGNKQREVVKAAIDKLKADSKFTMNLPAPETSKAALDYAGRPSKGPATAKVTVAEFSDFQCPYCSRATPAVDALLKAYPNDVKVVFFHYPLSFHENAMPSAIAAQCANLQGKFWEMHDKLFANQGALSADNFKAYAKDIALDEAKFTACLADPTTKAFVEKDMEMGNSAGVEGTPSFFLNGVSSASGAPTPDQIKPLL